MRENCTYGLTRGRAYPARGALLYSTKIDTVAEFLVYVHMRKNRVIEQNRCYHPVCRLAYRAFFLYDGEKDRAVARMRRVEAGVQAIMSYCINKLTLLTSWFDFSQKHRDTLMKGRFRAYNPESQCPVLEAESAAERIIGAYMPGMVVPCGKSDRPIYVLNGTLSNDVVVDVERASHAEVFDTFGRRVGALGLKASVQRVKIPQGGFLSVKPNGC